MTAILHQTLQTLYAYRLKSALAMIAIAWGVISVVVLIALGEGFYRQQMTSFQFLLNQTQIVVPSETAKPWQGLASRRPITMTEAMVHRLELTPLIRHVAMVYGKQDAQATNEKGQFLTSSIGGVGSQYLALASLHLAAGSRNISPNDIKHHSRIAIVGGQIAVMGKITHGDMIKVNGIPFHVVGVLQSENNGTSFGDDRKVLIPASTFKDIWEMYPEMLLVQPAARISNALLRQHMLDFFSKQLHFDPTDKDAVMMPDLSGGAQMITAIFRGIQAFLGASGVMTMAVGALGVANIMFLSVTERTREIGVRLALGATRRSILIQFVIEGMILIVCGTLSGFAVAYGMVTLLDHVTLPTWLGHPVITTSAVILSVMVTGLLAALASYFPAQRAAKLTPVTALSARV